MIFYSFIIFSILFNILVDEGYFGLFEIFMKKTHWLWRKGLSKGKQWSCKYSTHNASGHGSHRGCTVGLLLL